MNLMTSEKKRKKEGWGWGKTFFCAVGGGKQILFLFQTHKHSASTATATRARGCDDTVTAMTAALGGQAFPTLFINHGTFEAFSLTDESSLNSFTKIVFAFLVIG